MCATDTICRVNQQRIVPRTLRTACACCQGGSHNVFLNRIGIFFQLCTRALEVVGNTHQHLRPWNHTLAPLFWWEIGATKKWSPVGQTKDIERPTARLLDHLHRFHVDLIHIRTLFAIHLHTDEVLIHQLGDIVTLKTLMRHHMTPVAGRITDRN